MNKKTSLMGVPLKDLDIRKDAIIAGIVRANVAVIPGGGNTIQMNDNVVVVTTNQHIRNIEDILNHG